MTYLIIYLIVIGLNLDQWPYLKMSTNFNIQLKPDTCAIPNTNKQLGNSDKNKMFYFKDDRLNDAIASALTPFSELLLSENYLSEIDD